MPRVVGVRRLFEARTQGASVCLIRARLRTPPRASGAARRPLHYADPLSRGGGQSRTLQAILDASRSPGVASTSGRRNPPTS